LKGIKTRLIRDHPDPSRPLARLDADLKLDACRCVVTRNNGEVESVAVEDRGGNGDLNDMMQEQHAGALTAHTTLGPRFSAPAALMTRQPHGHLDRRRDTAPGFTRRQEDSRLPSRWLVDKESSTDAVNRQSDGGEVDHDFVGEAAHVHTAIIGGHEGNRFTTERTEGISSHENAGTIGIGRGEVNGQ
jgi:hypothetical protein